MNIAGQILKKYEDTLNKLPEKGKGSLRFGRVSISNIAAQYYCEQKLDLASEFPTHPQNAGLES